MDEEILLDDQQPVEVPDVVDEPYSVDNPLPVIVIDEAAPVGDIEVYAATGSSYGTISSTYLDYFEGIVEKLDFNDHYVVWKSGDYSYSMAFGDDMEINDTLISGYDLDVVRLYRSSDNYNSLWYTKFEEVGNLELETEQLYVYSDLGNLPTLKRGLSGIEGSMLTFAIGFAVAFYVCHDFFDYIIKHVRK